MNPRTLLLFMPLSLVLGACATLPNEHHITIDSQPPGATIRASGREVGVTPLTVRPDDIFPPRWKNMSYAVNGTLELRKTGCEPFILEVSDPVLSNDIRAELKCRKTAQPAHAVVTPAAGDRDPVEARLQRIQGLYERGVITETEYRRARAQVLEQL